ncbi:MAG: IS1380-like element ISEcp1 family transposase [Calditrichia bacterium]
MKQINTILPRFKKKNLTVFAGLNPMFQYLAYNLNIFDLLDQQVLFKKKKKYYTKADYFKILFVFFLIGFERIKHVLLLAQDQFVLRFLTLSRIVMPENIVRCFLANSTVKHTYQLGQVNGNLLKKKHQKIITKLTNGYCIIDCDSTTRDTHGHQEASGKHYKNHNGYHPIMAFIYQTEEFLHGYLRPGKTYTGNSIVEFLSESLMRLPYSINTILFRADSGFFYQYAFQLLEKLNHFYLVADKLHKPLMQRILQIPDKAYRLFSEEEGYKKEITVIHYQLPSWDKSRKLVIVRTVKDISDQLTFDGLNIEYTYRVYCTNLLLAAEEIVLCYQQRGNSENYIKEIK